MRSSALLFLLVALTSCAVDTAPSRLTCGLFGGRELCYEEHDGRAIYQGDIVLPLGAIELASPAPARRGVGLRPWKAWGTYWYAGVVPYVVEPGVPPTQQAAIQEAIAHYHASTGVRFVPRGAQPDFVAFTPVASGPCASYVGNVSAYGRQEIFLPAGCPKASIIYEMGHALGLFHEHERNDRDTAIVVHFENMTPGCEANYQKVGVPGQSVLPFDFASIMHYDPYACSRNGLPTVTRLDGSLNGFPRPKQGLSAGDVESLRILYEVYGWNRPSRFISRCYDSILARPANGGEISGWLEELVRAGGAAAGPRESVALGFFSSDEARARRLRTYYERFLGRAGSPAEIEGWVAHMKAGTSEESVRASFLGSPEYFSRNGSDHRRFVEALYRDVLGRGASPAEIEYYATRLDAGASRRDVAWGFLHSTEHRTRLVDEAFRAHLGRAAHDGDFGHWVAQLERGLSWESLWAKVLASEEAYERLPE